ncbi:hypothetical protein KP509_02G095000 [Ceratopteris richardii]|uniref:Uncharacterized protein n=1 Tax=Ceratopteris richardii TaxID=49495 RepID=A0A8T2VGQ4_CERRI|nr:hypothetical protein KP509_02G095000 [Ceratopteris richardii]
MFIRETVETFFNFSKMVILHKVDIFFSHSHTCNNDTISANGFTLLAEVDPFFLDASCKTLKLMKSGIYYWELLKLWLGS